MAKPQPYLDKLRNIGIIAHIDAGKTTLTERILFYTSKIYRMGEVHEGAATMDFMPEEQERGITIASACVTCPWDGFDVNLIDTPGHVDFSIEVERSLRVLDGVVGVFCAVGGVEPQTETVWRQANKFKVPQMAFINKLDRPGASYATVFADIKAHLGANVVPITIPLGEGDELEAIIDVLHMKRYDFNAATQGKEFSTKALSADELTLAAPWREKLLEAAADESDALMELYLAGEEAPVELLIEAIHNGTIKRSVVPVYAGSALKNIGVQPLLDGVCAFLPNPAEAPKTKAMQLANGVQTNCIELDVNPDAPLAALVFKVVAEGSRRIAFVRIYSGTLSEGLPCHNSSRNNKEKIANVYRLEAGERVAIPAAKAGDIVALSGLTSVTTGDSLSGANGQEFLLEKITGYQPVISISLEPKNSVDGEKLDKALQRFLLEDPTLCVEIDENSGQRIISGMGELHLEVLQERLKREYTLEPRAGKPQVLCHETVTGTAEARGEFRRELGAVQHFGAVTLRISQKTRGQGNEVRWLTERGSVLVVWAEEIDRGIESSLQSGVMQGYPVQDVLVEVLAVEKEASSSPAGYHMATIAAFRQAFEAAAPVLLEPVMRLEISVPESNLGAALNILTTIGGKIDNMDERHELRLVRALAPMRFLFGFSTSLRSATQGRAGFVMRFDHFG